MQLGGWISDGGGIVAEGADGCPQAMGPWGSLDGHGPVELLEGPRDAAHGKGRVTVSKPCLLRVGVVVGEVRRPMPITDKLKVVQLHGGPAS